MRWILQDIISEYVCPLIPRKLSKEEESYLKGLSLSKIERYFVRIIVIPMVDQTVKELLKGES